MAAAYQCQSSSQDQPQEENHIGGTTTTPPNKTRGDKKLLKYINSNLKLHLRSRNADS